MPVRFAACDVGDFFDGLTWAGPSKDWIASATGGTTDELWTAVTLDVGAVLGVKRPPSRWR